MQKRREREREREREEEFLRRGIGDQKKSGDPTKERFRVYQWVQSLFFFKRVCRGLEKIGIGTQSVKLLSRKEEEEESAFFARSDDDGDTLQNALSKKGRLSRRRRRAILLEAAARRRESKQTHTYIITLLFF